MIRRFAATYESCFGHKLSSVARRCILHSAVFAWLLGSFFVHPASASSFMMDEFVEASTDAISAIVPKLPQAYPGARFFISGISAPFGHWTFIRIEETSVCDSDICPTVIVRDGVEWKVAIFAKKIIEVTIGSLNERTVMFRLISKGKSEVIVRYAGDENILSVLP